MTRKKVIQLLVIILVVATTLIALKRWIDAERAASDQSIEILIKEIKIKDSIEVLHNQLLQAKYDSLIEIHEREIKIQKKRESELISRLNNINSDFPELPDLRTDQERGE